MESIVKRGINKKTILLLLSYIIGYCVAMLVLYYFIGKRNFSEIPLLTTIMMMGYLIQIPIKSTGVKSIIKMFFIAFVNYSIVYLACWYTL